VGERPAGSAQAHPHVKSCHPAEAEEMSPV
jgi:hypothetical protein